MTIRTGDERGRSVPVEGERFLIGREPSCDLTLHDSKMSRHHASIVRLQDGVVELRDLGSSNGTFVNGERVGVAPLRGGEQVQFGDTVLATSLEKPGRVSGSTVLGSLPRSLTGESAVHRLVLQRSVRRATVLGIAAIVVAASIGVLFATNVLPPGSGQELTAVQRVVRQAAAGTVLVEAQRDGRRVG
ncbi:MAG: FHA domain-containing protein, partial [Actinobacteria bacterium]|nr:FHA domain-containing protein [Actinomycetota bacterium]